MRHLRLVRRVITAVTALCLAEIFDYSGRSFRESQLDLIRRSLGDGSDDFWDLIPAVWELEEIAGHSVLTFQERRNEYEALGYACEEVQRGYEQEMFEAGIIPVCSDENREVIAARYKRRSKATD